MLTLQQKLYAEGRFKGKTCRAAAIYAGCPAGTASQQATRYEKHHAVVEHMIRLGMNLMPLPVKVTPTPGLDEAVRKITERVAVQTDETFTCPLQYMEHVMNNQIEDPKLRLEAAKSLASYTVAKASEKGKKEERQDAAERVAGSGRFVVAKAPLKVVK